MLRNTNYKRSIILCIVKLSCFIFLFYNVILIGEDYLQYPHTFTLSYETNTWNPGIDVINICTESNVLFNYLKFNQFLGLNETFNQTFNEFKLFMKNATLHDELLYHIFTMMNMVYINYTHSIIINKKSNLNKMKTFIPNANEFIKCIKINENLITNCNEFFE